MQVFQKKYFAFAAKYFNAFALNSRVENRDQPVLRENQP
jgi:hypothetical protein